MSNAPRVPSPLVLAAATAVLGALPAQAPNPQRVAFVAVGSVPAARALAFEQFFAQRFATVRRVGAEQIATADLADIDVVVLDWPQADGVSKWMGDRSLPVVAPLGERALWRTPTVLLGSAGLNLAVAWDVRGGAG
ncbi:MAG: hypothetical protein H6835_17545 [Planctomycetes bacterium]|nr:hypothetical protein [Planctomycetota bacterium]